MGLGRRSPASCSLDYLLHNLADSGITRACIVIGPTHDAVRKYYRGLTTRRIGIEFAIWVRHGEDRQRVRGDGDPRRRAWKAQAWRHHH